MNLEDTKISRAIIETYNRSLTDALVSDVIIVGAGPSGLVAASYLAKAGVKTTVLEQKLSVGGGMWGGGIMMNQVVFQEDARELFTEFNITCSPYKQGYYTANSVESVAALTLGAIKAGAKIFNLITAEDIMVKKNRVAGLVINWTAVHKSGLHVDPITMEAKYVLDATGHDAVVVNKLIKRMGSILFTSDGTTQGEKPMWAQRGEEQVVANTGEAFHGLFVCGMAANATFGGQRMGPIFGGMLLSGRRAAEAIIQRLGSENKFED